MSADLTLEERVRAILPPPPPEGAQFSPELKLHLFDFIYGMVYPTERPRRSAEVVHLSPARKG